MEKSKTPTKRKWSKSVTNKKSSQSDDESDEIIISDSDEEFIPKKRPSISPKKRQNNTGKTKASNKNSKQQHKQTETRIHSDAEDEEPEKTLDEKNNQQEVVLISDDEDGELIIGTNSSTLNGESDVNVRSKFESGTKPFRDIKNRNIQIEKNIGASQKPKVATTIKAEEIQFEWEDYELLAQQKGLNLNVSRNIVKLFEEGNTIPFIARYRRDATQNMPPEMIRDVRDCFEDICHLKQKIGTVLKTVEKAGSLNKQFEKSIRSVRSMEELEIMYAPYKPGTKRSLAERAKDLGLERPAMNILNNTEQVTLTKYVDVSKKELRTVKDVEKHVVHIIAQVIATDSEMLSLLRKLRSEVNFCLECKKSNLKSTSKAVTKAKSKGKQPEEYKFENYFDYKSSVWSIKPHQVLAINRGEHHKILSVKIFVPDFVHESFSTFCHDKWVKKGRPDSYRENLLCTAMKDAYTRLVQPLIIREIRSDLKTTAEKVSHEVFSNNLKNLLLAAPLKGQSILAIDPGFKGGCKLALVSPTGSLLSNNFIYPHGKDFERRTASQVLGSMLREHRCTLIALGNGTACRETEAWLTDLIQNKYFAPLDVKYTIVAESGASIYSCSPEAKKEFPTLDTNIISAVSLARRIQDPMAELVKIEPQHLGVGMYQHDLKKKTLEEALSDVVSECVSFVGVDLNTASQCLLRRIAGLTDKRASQIILHRTANGPFLYRKQLTKVFGIGPRVFQQCAGFLRVGPASAKEAADFYKKPDTSKLDCTYIHPESYDIAERILKKYGFKCEDVGEPRFINFTKTIYFSVSELSKELQSTEETVKLILEAFAKPLNYDMRSEVSQVPLFRKGLTSINDLKVDTVVKGVVRNVTHFGCFVDVGVEKDGLIHNSRLNGFNLQLGDRVEARVEKLNLERLQISLLALAKL